MTTLCILFVRRDLYRLPFFRIHALPHDGSSGQPQNVVLLNKLNIQAI